MHNRADKETQRSSRKIGATQQKIIVLLMAGASLALTRSPRQYFRIIGQTRNELREISKGDAERALNSLHKRGFIEAKQQRDGTYQMDLTSEGDVVARSFKLNSIKPRSKKPSKKWRIVSFDIPEELKENRDSFRFHLKRFGCYEMNQSVFVHRIACEKELLEIAHGLEIDGYLHIAIADSITNDDEIREYFSAFFSKQ